MARSAIDAGCSFHGELATGRDGRLFERRMRQTLESRRAPLTERERSAVEALTALRVASKIARHRMDRWAEKHGLSEGRLHVLWQLLGAPNHMLPLGELADQLDVTPRNVTGLIDHLERDGLVERVDDPDDRRSTFARLTKEGGRLLQGMRGEGLRWQLAMTEGLSTEELSQLRHGLLRLVENMSGATAARREA